jgi:Cys-tRNA(Pro) deacylase
MRDASDVERTAEQLKISATLHGSLDDASTVEAAAEALGVEPDTIGKSIVLMVDDEAAVVVVVPGPREADLAKVAEHVDADPDKVRMAEPDEIEEHTGFPVGAVPPLGHKRPLRTVLDSALLDRGEVYVGGGSDDVMLAIDSSDLKKLPDVSTGDVSS